MTTDDYLQAAITHYLISSALTYPHRRGVQRDGNLAAAIKAHAFACLKQHEAIKNYMTFSISAQDDLIFQAQADADELLRKQPVVSSTSAQRAANTAALLAALKQGTPT